VFVPLMTPALFLMGVGPLARWRQAGAIDLARRLRWAALVCAVSAALAPLAPGKWTPMVGFGLFMSAWVASTVVVNLLLRLREHPAPGWLERVRAQSGSYYGMLLAHLGVAVFVLGVTVVSGYQTESDVRMQPGESTTVGGYAFTMEDILQVKGPNYVAAQAVIKVTHDGEAIATLRPERRMYTVKRSPMTEVAIDRSIARDLYVALGEPVSASAWSVRVHHKPLVNLIWIGCLLMAGGGFLAVLDRRYRVKRTVVAGPAGLPTSSASSPPLSPLPQPTALARNSRIR
jgi:cytochrome c-type biogenesis protein CcmF